MLPDLPRVKNKREAKYTPIVLDWFRTHHVGSAAIEIKATKSASIPASALAPHQKLALFDASLGRGLVHKLSDAARLKQPFDALMLQNVPAYVVAVFITHKIALVIPADAWHGAKPTTPAAYIIEL
ncbi:MAG: hypothetical protein ACYDAK_13240 [Candidatus Limnocylindrales bacterium]